VEVYLGLVGPDHQNLAEPRMDTLLFDVWRENHDPAGLPGR